LLNNFEVQGLFNPLTKPMILAQFNVHVGNARIEDILGLPLFLLDETTP